MLFRTSLALFPLIASLVYGCSGEVSPEESATDSGVAGRNAGGSSSGGGGSAATGMAGESGGGNDAGVGGTLVKDAGKEEARRSDGAACVANPVYPDFSISFEDLSSYLDGCLSGNSGDVAWSTTGRVVETGPDRFTVDSCHAGTGCAPSLAFVRVEGPELVLNVPVNALVQVRYSGNKSGVAYVCRDAQMDVVRVDHWDNETNPIPGPPVYLSMGTTSPESGLTSKQVSDECGKLASIGCSGTKIEQEIFALEFVSDTGEKAVVWTAQEATISSSKGSFRVFNAIVQFVMDSVDCYPNPRNRYWVLPTE